MILFPPTFIPRNKARYLILFIAFKYSSLVCFVNGNIENAKMSIQLLMFDYTEWRKIAKFGVKLGYKNSARAILFGNAVAENFEGVKWC
jgi:hypothetical protein